MKKVWLGVFSALALAATACSSSSSSGTTCPAGEVAVTINGSTTCGKINTDGGTDGVAPGDTGHPTDSAGHDVTSLDSPPGDGPATSEGTVGKACTGSSDTSCDPLGTGDNLCDAVDYPTPVCIGKSCDIGDGTKIMGCDPDASGNDLGVCLQAGTGGICLPACSFDNSATAPAGCLGKDACNPYGWSTTAPINGIGYCYSGCFADSDCPTGLQCQVEYGSCTKSKKTFASTPGTACTFKTAAGATQDCFCYAARTTNTGYCTQFCEVGKAGCPTGLSCSAALPSTSGGSPLFTATPAGLGGVCLKTCTADSDCTAINSTCQQASDGKFCFPYTLNN